MAKMAGHMNIKNTLTTMIVIGLVLFAALPESRGAKFFNKDKVIRVLVGYTPGGGHNGPACGPARGQIHSRQTKPHVTEMYGRTLVFIA